MRIEVTRAARQQTATEAAYQEAVQGIPAVPAAAADLECPVLPAPVSAAAHRAAPETVQTARPAAIPITAHPAHQLRLNQDGQTDQVD